MTKIKLPKSYFGLNVDTWYSIFTLLGLLFFLLWLMKMNEPKIISPLSDNPIVPKVLASTSENVGQLDDAEVIIKRVTGRFSGPLIKIAKCESSLRSGVVSHTGDYGLFQINLKAHQKRIPGRTLGDKTVWLSDPENNTWIAYALFLEQGYRPWRSSYRCHGYK